MYYNRFRYYDPNGGAYISQDPIGLEGGNPNIYGYVKDSNVWMDILGLDGYRTWQIHSPGVGGQTDDVIVKGLHFYAPGNVELAIKPDEKGGITFGAPHDQSKSKFARDNYRRAVRQAQRRFENNEKWRKEILDNATKAKHNLANGLDKKHKHYKLAQGRSGEMHFIEKAIKNYGKKKKGKTCTKR